MSGLNWGMIEGGGAFESLVYTLLYDEDSSVILFGRPGKDSGQDARTKDGTRVYQAKFRNGMTMSTAIDLAKTELDTILKYRKTTHPNSKHWAHVTRWTLIANFAINPNDEAAWQRDVVPAFRQIGITADYWSLEKLEPEIINRPHLRDVFFNGNNRTLVCAREAFDSLSGSSPGPSFLDTKLLGRQSDLGKVDSFLNSSDSAILAVIGVHGVGKTSFLYDSMLAAEWKHFSKTGSGEKEWRVFWGLTESMNASSDWFRLLNSSSKTCVFIDGVDSRNLLKRIREQATTTERRDWKFILSIQPEHESILREFPDVATIELKNLSEMESQQLSSNCLGTDHRLIQSKEAFRLYPLTQGLPAWQCMILEECKNQPSFHLPETFPDFVRHLIDSELASISPDLRDFAKTMLQWFAAWDVVKIEGDDPEEYRFLASEGIPKNLVDKVRSALVKSRLISKWGISGRSHAVEPAIIRQQILCDWLLEPTVTKHQYVISREGLRFVKELLHFQIPNTPSVLQNLCRMAIAYLPDQDSTQFLHPIFEELKRIANGDSIREQYNVLELLKRIGHTNPDAALEVLATLRARDLSDETVDHGFWGHTTLSHKDLLPSVSEYLFVVAKEATTEDTAQRFVAEIQNYLDLEEATDIRFVNGQEPSNCLRRLIGHPHCAHQYAAIAAEQLREGWDSLHEKQFLRIALQSIWDPNKETVTQWGRTIAFQRVHYVAPDNFVWKLCLEFRDKAFLTLHDAEANNELLRRELWRQLGHSVSQFDYLSSLIAADKTDGQLVLSRIHDDLQNTFEILDAKKDSVSLEELADARTVWFDFLSEHRQSKFGSIARQCERVFQDKYKWPVPELLSATVLDEEKPIKQIVSMLRQGSDVSMWRSLFETTERYLLSIDPEKRNSQVFHYGRLVETYCRGVESIYQDPIMAFARDVVTKASPSLVEKVFVEALGRQLLLEGKRNLTSFSTNRCLEPFLNPCPWKTETIWAIFQHPHPNSHGPLTVDEFRYLSDSKQGFSDRQQAEIISPFFGILPEQTETLLSGILSHATVEEQSGLTWTIAESVYLTGLRYDWAPGQIPIDWLMDKVVHLKLDANILEASSLRWMREETGWKFTMERFLQFVQSRIELESVAKPYDRFSIWPHRFPADKWCTVGPGEKEQEAFDGLCEIATERKGYIALFECPELLPKIDPDGTRVGEFAMRYFANHPKVEPDALYRLAGLVVYYEEGSPGWRTVATEICKRSILTSEKDRSRIFQGFRARSTFTEWSIGSVPKEVEDNVETKRVQYEQEPSDSPLKSFFRWSLDLAQKELTLARQRAEEERHEDL